LPGVIEKLPFLRFDELLKNRRNISTYDDHTTGFELIALIALRAKVCVATRKPMAISADILVCLAKPRPEFAFPIVQPGLDKARYHVRHGIRTDEFYHSVSAA
jgi:hypothetical protein